MTPILEVKNLMKTYPGVTAVDDISFSIRPGICFGLLGPNGAGKTTTIEISENIISATSGEILYKGKKRTSQFSEEIGIQFQSTVLLNFLSVEESLDTFRRLYRRPVEMSDIIRTCFLKDILERRNDKISGGQKQRLLLAIALINDPELIFLDEPTTGLDPQARRHLWRIVEDIKARGKTVVLTTHYMEEAQFLCEEIIIIDKGKILAEGVPDQLVKEHCRGVVVRIPKSIPDHILDALRSGQLGADVDPGMSETATHLEIRMRNVNALLRMLLDQGVDMSSVSMREHNLEDLFLQLTGRSLRE